MFLKTWQAAAAAAPFVLAAPAFAATPAFNDTVTTRMVPQTEALLVKLISEKRDLVIDGQRVFDASKDSGGDKFLSGKIANGMAWLIVTTPRNDPRFGQYMQGFRELSRLTIHDKVETWGIYYYISALKQLKDAGLLEQCVDSETLEKLKTKLDWRSFVRPDLSLIDLPNNYYGVAFSIAGLRQQLGWEDATGKDALVTKVLGHYRTFSESGFADETEGDGRFDRYSVLLIAEIAHHHIKLGMTPPQQVRDWLRGSAKLVLARLNAQGDGFEYGRSIGAYGDTSLVEVLAIAAKMGVLTPEEMDAAYTYSSVSADKYMRFWVDADTGSVNLWDKGRRTDAYRGKHRILGENLSLAQQYFYTNALWNELGYKDRPPTTDLKAWRRAQPELTTTWFARGDYDRALITRRDGDRMFGLALINGGQSQHMNSPYFPVPFSPGLVAAVADSGLPQLVPHVTLRDGTKLAPLAYFRNVKVTGKTVAWHQTESDRLGQSKPQPDARLKVKTAYRFAAKAITRTDILTPAQTLDVQSIDMEFASFSTGTLKRKGKAWVVTYGPGAARTFAVSGFSTCELKAVNDRAYQTPEGAFASTLKCTIAAKPLSAPLTVSWTLTYD